jgi:hypothetical protein
MTVAATEPGGGRPTLEELAGIVGVPLPPKLSGRDARTGTRGAPTAGGVQNAARGMWLAGLAEYGWSMAEAAEILGYRSAGSARLALTAYLRTVEDQPANEYRARLRARIEWTMELTAERLMNPSILVTVKGDPVTDPRTGEYVTDDASFYRGVGEYGKLIRNAAVLSGADPVSAAKANLDQADYELKIQELLRVVRPDIIEATVISDTQTPLSVDDKGQDPEQQPGSDEGGPAGAGLHEPRDKGSDEEAQDGEDLQETVDT